MHLLKKEAKNTEKGLPWHSFLLECLEHPKDVFLEELFWNALRMGVRRTSS